MIGKLPCYPSSGDDHVAAGTAYELLDIVTRCETDVFLSKECNTQQFTARA